MSSIKTRILEYLDFKGIQREDFFRKINMSYSSFRGEAKERPLNSDAVDSILTLSSDLNPLWLISNKGSMLLDDIKLSHVNEPQAVYSMRTDSIQEAQRIPLFDIEAAAGIIPMFENIGAKPIDEYISLPRVPKCDGAVFITGDSMYPLLKSGDIVAYKIIHDYKNEIFWGEMYLISIEMADEFFMSVKYVQKSEIGEDWIKLVSQNSNHQSKDIEIKRIRSMAIVKASVRINSM
jgi:phage repressor protein C with HTH and peptisase S24 domain